MEEVGAEEWRRSKKMENRKWKIESGKLKVGTKKRGTKLERRNEENDIGIL